MPLARSTALRDSSLSVRSSTSASTAVISANRARAISIAGLPRPIDQLPLAEGGQHHHRGDPLAGDLLGGADAVQLGHLDVHHHQVGAQIGGQGHRSLPVAGLPDDLISLFGQHLDQVEADQDLVLGHDHSGRACAVAGLRIVVRHPLTLASACYADQSSPSGGLAGGVAPGCAVECREGESNPYVLADRRV
jgi:hypothetical protein